MIAAHSGGDGGSGGAAPGEGPATGKLINPLVDGSFGPSGVDIDPTAIHGKPIPGRLLPYMTPPEIAPPENAASRMVHDRIFKASQQHGQQPPQPGLHPGPFPPPPPPPFPPWPEDGEGFGHAADAAGVCASSSGSPRWTCTSLPSLCIEHILI